MAALEKALILAPTGQINDLADRLRKSGLNAIGRAPRWRAAKTDKRMSVVGKDRDHS